MNKWVNDDKSNRQTVYTKPCLLPFSSRTVSHTRENIEDSKSWDFNYSAKGFLPYTKTSIQSRSSSYNDSQSQKRESHKIATLFIKNITKWKLFSALPHQPWSCFPWWFVLTGACRFQSPKRGSRCWGLLRRVAKQVLRVSSLQSLQKRPGGLNLRKTPQPLYLLPRLVWIRALPQAASRPRRQVPRLQASHQARRHPNLAQIRARSLAACLHGRQAACLQASRQACHHLVHQAWYHPYRALIPVQLQAVSRQPRQAVCLQFFPTLHLLHTHRQWFLVARTPILSRINHSPLLCFPHPMWQWIQLLRRNLLRRHRLPKLWSFANSLRLMFWTVKNTTGLEMESTGEKHAIQLTLWTRMCVPQVKLWMRFVPHL